MRLRDFLQQHHSENGVVSISEPRAFMHPEEDYDHQYGIDQLNMDFHTREGKALFDLCAEYGWDSSRPVLEIGCGTGRLSLSLLLGAPRCEMLVTDPSPEFCRITARKLSVLLDGQRNYSIAVLGAEDVERLPEGAFSAIFLRSVLHHVLDVNRFFADCARILIPGGVLIFEEPCSEGYLLMGAITQILARVLPASGVKFTEGQAQHVQIFADAMMYYARRDLDKSKAEDKHLFRPDELMRMARDCGMNLDFFSNRVFANIECRREPLPDSYFEQFYFDYIKYALSWDADLIAIFDQHAREYLRYFAPLAKGGALPYTHSTFICQKASSAPGC